MTSREYVFTLIADSNKTRTISAMTDVTYGATPSRPKNWIERNWKWFVPLMVLVLALCAAAFVALVFSIVEFSFRSSYPYQNALERAKASAAVGQTIGTPIQVGWFTTGNIQVSGSNGDAQLSIPISGGKGRGEIIVVAKKRGGQWTFDTLQVQVDGQNAPIDLLKPVIPSLPSSPRVTSLISFFDFRSS